MNKNLEGVIIIRNKKDEIIGFVRNDLDARHPVLYRAEPMNFQDLEELFQGQLEDKTLC